MLFSDPYIAAGQQIVVRGDSAIAGPDDLAGRTVGVQINTTAQFAMEKRPGVTLAKYNTIDLALLDLQNGRIDAVASDGPVLRYMMRTSFPGLKTVGAEYTDEQFGIVLARGSDDLRRAVNAALWRLQDSGEYAKIYAKWFGEARRAAAPRPPRPRALRPGDHRADLVVLRARRVDDRGDGRRRACCSACRSASRWRWRACSRTGSVTAPAAVYVEVMRGTPLLVQILFVYFVLPSVGVNLPAFTSGILALTLNAAAYISRDLSAPASSRSTRARWKRRARSA